MKKNESMIRIAIIITCFNRCEKTVKCLESLYLAEDSYNNHSAIKISTKLFLTDDGCTDETADTVLNLFSPEHDISIINGDGHLYWAGGMRAAWNKALQDDSSFDYYLLVNDDTFIFPNAFDLLFELDEAAKSQYERQGIYSGICCASFDQTVTTYGGDVWVDLLSASRQRLSPSGFPQSADLVNSNILLVPNSVVAKQGIFFRGYHHAHADYDYSMRAKRNGFPVLLSSHYCGMCDNDHISQSVVAENICAMNLWERIRYFNNPLHSNSDYLLFIRRNTPYRLFPVLLGRLLNIFFPKLYYKRYR